jgi:hypothetical protein
MCIIDWTALGTWILAICFIGTLILIWKQINIAHKQMMTQIKISQEQMKAQTFISREQMKVTIQINLIDKFESDSMKAARSKLADQILNKCEHDEIQETVLNIFEDIGIFLRRDYLDKELVWASFAFHAIRWWSILKDYVLEERKMQDDDDTIFEDFENLVKTLYEIESVKRRKSRADLEPDWLDIDQFLKDEVNLLGYIQPNPFIT